MRRIFITTQKKFQPGNQTECWIWINFHLLNFWWEFNEKLLQGKTWGIIFSHFINLDWPDINLLETSAWKKRFDKIEINGPFEKIFKKMQYVEVYIVFDEILLFLWRS